MVARMSACPMPMPIFLEKCVAGPSTPVPRAGHTSAPTQARVTVRTLESFISGGKHAK